MNEEAFKDLYQSFINTGYNGSESDFKDLMSTNTEAFSDGFGEFARTGYNGDEDDFAELIGVVNPLKKKGEGSALASGTSGGSEPNLADVQVGDITTAETYAGTIQDYKGEVPQQQQPTQDFSPAMMDMSSPDQPLTTTKIKEDIKAEEERLAFVKDESAPGFERLQELLQKVDLTNKSEEKLVPELNYLFKEYGFQFEEATAGNAVKVIAPNGQEKLIEYGSLLDLADPTGLFLEKGIYPRLSEAIFGGSEKYEEELRDFIKENRVISQNAENEKKKFISEQEVKDYTNNFNQSAKDYLAKSKELEKERLELAQKYNKVPSNEQEAEVLAQIKKEFEINQLALKDQYEELKTKAKKYDASIGEYAMMRTEQGGFFRQVQDSMKGGFGSALAFVVDLAVTGGATLGGVSDEDLKEFKYGKEEKFINPFSEKATKISRDSEKGFIESVEDLPFSVMGRLSTKEYLEDRQQADLFSGKGLQNILFGVSEFIPLTMATGGFGTVALSSQYVNKEMQDDPDFDDVGEMERLAVSLGIGTVVGVLEKVGFKNVMQSKAFSGFTTSIATKALGKNPATMRTFNEYVEQEVKSLMAKGALKLGAGFTAEFETGAAQEAAEMGLKNLYNMAKGSDLFKTPEGTIESFKEIIMGGIAEGMGGAMMAVPGSLSSALKKNQLSEIDDTTFAVFEEMSTNSEYLNMVSNKLDQQVVNQEITKEDRDRIFNDYNRLNGAMQKMPKGIKTSQKKQLLGLFMELQKVKDNMNSTDDAFNKRAKKQKEQIEKRIDGLLKDNDIENTVDEVLNTEPSDTKVFYAEKLEDIPEQHRDNATLVENAEEEISFNEKILGLPIGKEKNVAVGDYYTYTLNGTEIDQVVESETEVDNEIETEADDSLMDSLFEEVESKKKVEEKVEPLESPAERKVIDVLGTQVSIDGKEGTLKEDGERIIFETIETDPEAQKEIERLESSKRRTEKSEKMRGFDVSKAKLDKEYDEKIAKLKNKTIKRQVDLGNKNDLRLSTMSDIGAKQVQLSAAEQTTFDGKEFNAPPIQTTKGEYISGKMTLIGSRVDKKGRRIVTVKDKNGLKKRFTGDAAEQIMKAFKNQNVESKGKGDYFSSRPPQGTSRASEQVSVIGGDSKLSNRKRAKYERIVNMAVKAMDAISRVLPDLKILVHTNESTFVDEFGAVARGAFDPATNIIHINLQRANFRTVGHEVLHAILVNRLKTDRNVAIAVNKMIDSVKKSVPKDVAAELEAFVKKYRGSIKNEEYIAELFGILSERYNSFPSRAKNAIRDFIRAIQDLFNLPKSATIRDQEVFDFITTMARKVGQGEIVQESDLALIEDVDKEIKAKVRKKKDPSIRQQKVVEDTTTNVEDFLSNADNDVSPKEGYVVMYHKTTDKTKAESIKDKGLLLSNKKDIGDPMDKMFLTKDRTGYSKDGSLVAMQIPKNKIRLENEQAGVYSVIGDVPPKDVLKVYNQIPTKNNKTLREDVLRDFFIGSKGGEKQGKKYIQEQQLKDTPSIRQQKFDGEENYEKWKGDNVELEGTEIQDAQTGEPIVAKVYHGTTNEFYEFDASVKGNIEGHLGKVNYFTSDVGDANQNYQSEGPDLTIRVEGRTERLAEDLMDEYGDVLDTDSAQELSSDYGIEISEGESVEDVAKKIAEKELVGTDEKVLDLYVKLNNPAVVGTGRNFIDVIPEENYADSIEDAAQEIAEEYDVTIEEAKEDYSYEVRERAIDLEGIENPLIEALQEAIDENTDGENLSAAEILQDFTYDDVVDLNQLEKAVREGVAYTTTEEGQGASSQIVGQMFKNLGYDGIILTDVSQRFKNMGLGEGTSHVHVFDEFNNQIKLADGSNVTFGETADIRFQKGKQTIQQIIKNALAKGVSVKKIKEYLMKNKGYTQSEVDALFPKPKKKVKQTKASLVKMIEAKAKNTKKGKVSLSVTNYLINQTEKLNYNNAAAVQAFVDKVAKIYDRAGTLEEITTAKKNRTGARKSLKKAKLGASARAFVDAANEILSIKIDFIPLELLEEYNEVMAPLAKRETVKIIDVDTIRMQELLAKIQEQLEEQAEAKPEKGPTRADKNRASNIKLIKERRGKIKNELSNKYENDLADFLLSITDEQLDQMSSKSVEVLNNLLSQIENGYLSSFLASKLKTEVDGKIEGGGTLLSKINMKAAGKLYVNSMAKIYTKLTGLFSKDTDLLSIIRSTALSEIDSLLGNFNARDIYNKTFGKLESAKSKYDTELNNILNKLDKFNDLISGGKVFKVLSNKQLMSKFRIMASLLQDEFDANPGAKGVASALDYIDGTIAKLEEGNKRQVQEAELLSKLKEEIEKKGIVLSKREEQAKKIIKDINNDITEKFMFVAAMRGENPTIYNSYMHHSAMYSLENQQQALESQTETLMNPSTKAGTTNERTTNKAISFDPAYSTLAGVKQTLLDFHMTQPIKEVRASINVVKKSKDRKKRQAGIALEKAFKESLQIVLSHNLSYYGMAEKAMDNIRRLSYYATLASVPRAAAELVSNMSYAVLSNPVSFARGAKYKYLNLSVNGAKLMDVTGSGITNKNYSREALSGSRADSASFNRSLFNKSDPKGRIAEVSQFIAENSLVGPLLIKSTNYLAEKLISTPDKAIARPLWFGTFFGELQSLTGKKFTKKEILEMANGKSKYLKQYKSEIEAARIKADKENVQMSGSSNAFNSILKDQVRQTGKGSSATANAFRIINTYMGRFVKNEFNTVKSAIYALFNSGEISRPHAIGLIAAVTTRMTAYMVLYTMFKDFFFDLFDSDDDDDEKETDYAALAERQFVGSLTTLMTRRYLGNIPYIPIALATEYINETELESLRNGEPYDPFKNSLIYSPINTSDIKTKDPYELWLAAFGGPLGPGLKSLRRMQVVATRASTSAKKSTREKYKEEFYRRSLLELAGNLGLVPFYKDIRTATLNDLYKRSGKSSKKLNLTDAQKKKYMPELYRREKEYEKKLKSTDFYKREQKMKAKLKKQEEEMLKRIFGR